MRNTQPQVTRWDPTTRMHVDSLDAVYDIYQRTLGVFPSYALSPGKLHAMLSAPSAQVFVATVQSDVVAFAVTYTIIAGAYSDPAAQHLNGGLALLLVSPSYQDQGVGSVLHDAVMLYLEDVVRRSLSASSPTPSHGLILLGSWFPRFFPGLPEGSEFDEAEEWLATRGWNFQEEKDLPIDLYRGWQNDWTLYEEMDGLMALGRRNGYTFGRLWPGHEAALERLQRRNFYKTTGWPNMFTDMISAGCAENIHCAYNSQGELIGATIAAVHNHSQSSNPAHEALAFPDMIGKSCGIIACVGIDSSVRGGGAGTGMLASAILDMAHRGADGCFIDWTGIEVRSFYERLGFRKWMRGYREASRLVLRGIAESRIVTP